MAEPPRDPSPAPSPSPADGSDAEVEDVGVVEAAARRAEDELALRVERIRALSDQLQATRKELKVAKAEAERATAAAAAARAELHGFRSRTPIRLALAVVRRVRRLRRRSERPGGGAPGPKARAAGSAGSAGAAAPSSPVGAAARTRFQARVFAGSSADGGLRVATIGVDPAVGRSLAGLGWTVAESSAGTDAAARSADVVVYADPAADPRGASSAWARIAWVDDDPAAWLGRPWSDEYDIVLVPDEPAASAIRDATVHVPTVVDAFAGAEASTRLQAALAAWAAVPHLDVAIGPPNWDVATSWGDYHFGRALQRALLGRGLPTRLRLRGEWDTRGAERADAVIHLFGRVERPVRAGQLGVLWIISHPDLVTDAYVAAHDFVFAASDPFAAGLGERTGRTIHPLHQATDPRRFRPVEGGPPHELLFVANSRGMHRPVVDELSPTTRDLAIYGANWTDDRVDARYVRGSFVPNEELAAYYRAATIVLNDHWADMAAHGFFSNRLYDAAAAGAFVISDHVPGIDEEFDGGIVTFRDGRELRRLVEHYLADPEGRARHAAAAMAAVRDRHTMAIRAERILELIGPPLAERAARADIGKSR